MIMHINMYARHCKSTRNEIYLVKNTINQSESNVTRRHNECRCEAENYTLKSQDFRYAYYQFYWFKL